MTGVPCGVPAPVGLFPADWAILFKLTSSVRGLSTGDRGSTHLVKQVAGRATAGVEVVESSLVAYADESSVRHNADHQEYLVCAAIFERSELDEIRKELRPLLLPGQIKLHWTDEGSSRRRQIVRSVSGVDSFQVIVTNRSEISRKTERYRRKCLETLYFELGNMKIVDLTLESRQESQNRKDIEHIIALQAAGKCQGIRVTHRREATILCYGSQTSCWVHSTPSITERLNTGVNYKKSWCSSAKQMAHFEIAKTLGPVVRLGSQGSLPLLS